VQDSNINFFGLFHASWSVHFITGLHLVKVSLAWCDLVSPSVESNTITKLSLEGTQINAGRFANIARQCPSIESLDVKECHNLR
jgi:hypothetical protein